MKNYITYKTKSGALQFAIFIAVLIALLLSGLVLYAYTFQYLKEQSKAAIENIQLADSGINFILEKAKPTNDTILIQDLETNNQKVSVKLSGWGVFEKAYVKARHRKKEFIKMAILGSEINPVTAPTLYLQETYSPLSMVGNAKIEGNAYLPGQGVKPGYIAGQGFYDTRLIHGASKTSGTQLPTVEKHCTEELGNYLKAYKTINNGLDINSTDNQKTTVSFRDPTRNYYSLKPVVLQNSEITGNIIIKSDTLINVKKSAKLKDIILIAPEIMIEDEVSGNFQCIASKAIRVGKECKLSYPTALVLMQDNKDKVLLKNRPFDNQIFIDSRTIVKGVVCYFQTKLVPDFETQLVLETDSGIKGKVYCQGNFELKGTVSGSVYAKQFISNSAGSIFINHIFNGVITNQNLPDIYGGIIFENDKKSVLKWLY